MTTTTQRLTSFGEQTPAATSESAVATAVQNGRTALRHRTTRKRAGGALLAAIAITAVTAAGLTGQATPASAATLLSRAADGAETGSYAIPDGRFLKVSTQEIVLSYIWDAKAGEVGGGYLHPSTRTVWIPADKNDAWIRTATSGAPTEVFGGVDIETAASDEAAQLSDDPWQNGTVRAAGGAFAAELGGAPDRPGDLLESLPREPQLLLDYIRAAGEETDGGVLIWISGQLQSGIVDADLQATMYRTLALLPSLRVTEGQADLGGRSGTAIGVDNGSGNLNEIVLDKTTGEFIGQRTTQTLEANGIPAGTVIHSTAMSAQLVTDAP